MYGSWAEDSWGLWCRWRSIFGRLGLAQTCYEVVDRGSCVLFVCAGRESGTGAMIVGAREGRMDGFGRFGKGAVVFFGH